MYGRLNIFLITYVLFCSYVKASLETLTNKLRTLNGDIKDPRAAFMNRTKVCKNKMATLVSTKRFFIVLSTNYCFTFKICAV